jgi:hypothetical protein
MARLEGIKTPQIPPRKNPLLKFPSNQAITMRVFRGEPSTKTISLSLPGQPTRMDARNSWRKKSISTSLENFKNTLTDSWDTEMEWELSKNADLINKGDYIWAYFTRPVSGIHAVGTVQKKRIGSSFPGSPTVIRIKWDKTLTKKLWKSPITFKELGYAPRNAAIHAYPKYQKVLDARLPGNK